MRPGWGVLAGLLVLLAAIAAYVALSSGSNPGSETTQRHQVFSAQGFRTGYPAGWQVDVKHPGGSTSFYALTSTGAGVNAVNIPPRGTIAVSIEIFSTAALGRGLAGARTVQDLAARVIATPSTATDVRLVKSVHRLSLGDRPAGGVIYSYRYQGTRNFQKDIVTAHGGAVVFIELDTQHKLASRGNEALRAIVKHWRWTGGPLVSPSGNPA
jgi:hypothetical protein